MRSWILFAATLFLLFSAASLFVSIALNKVEGAVAEPAPGESLYHEVMEHVVRDHVDPIDEEQVVYGAMKGLASELDPHSRVFDGAEWAEFQRETQGEMTGIGIEVAQLGDALIIGWVAPQGPAHRAGIRPGERLLGLTGGPDDTDRSGLLRALRGAAGSRLELLLGDRDGKSTRRVAVTRGTFDVATVRVRVLDEAQVLYARVTAFRPHTTESLEQALKDVPLKTLKGVVLDLRFNRGGSFEPAVAMADLWLSEGVIVRTRGPNSDEVQRATPDAPLRAIPTVVLVNGMTASAAEVVAGALQDTQAALLVGERTFGKGVVQEVFGFRSWAGGMKLTTARYYTPADRCIDRGLGLRRPALASRGLVPDVVVATPKSGEPALERALERDSYPAWLKTALLERESAHDGDPQLDAALAVLAGRPADRQIESDEEEAPGTPR